MLLSAALGCRARCGSAGGRPGGRRAPGQPQRDDVNRDVLPTYRQLAPVTNAMPASSAAARASSSPRSRRGRSARGPRPTSRRPAHHRRARAGRRSGRVAVQVEAHHLIDEAVRRDHSAGHYLASAHALGRNGARRSLRLCPRKPRTTHGNNTASEPPIGGACIGRRLEPRICQWYDTHGKVRLLIGTDT